MTNGLPGLNWVWASAHAEHGASACIWLIGTEWESITSGHRFEIYMTQKVHMWASWSIVSCPAGKIGGNIRLVTLCTILGTSTYSAECNQDVNWHNLSHIEARLVNKCMCSSHFPSSELQWLIKCSISIGTLKFLPERVKNWTSIMNSAQCYQTEFSSDFSSRHGLWVGWRTSTLQTKWPLYYKGQSYVRRPPCIKCHFIYKGSILCTTDLYTIRVNLM